MKFPTLFCSIYLASLIYNVRAIRFEHPKYIQTESDIVPGRYIISFSENPHHSGSSQTFQKQFGSSQDFQIQEGFNHELFHGISIQIDTFDDKAHTATLKSIASHSGVRAVYPVKTIARPKINLEAISKIKGNRLLPHAMTQVDLVHSELKHKGKGILVGILDTGIDYLHPALGGGFGPGFKVVAGYDLVGDAYTGKNKPVPDHDPLDDCGADSEASGHGTHVAGIIAGYDESNNFTGVAPEATLGMWRVFGCKGSVTNDIVIKGLLMAYDAGCDVINLSLGETNAWSSTTDAESIVVNEIVSRGVSVVIAAGNEGSEGYYTVGQPGNAKSAFSVASVENSFYLTKDFRATGIDHIFLYTASGEDTIQNGTVVYGDLEPNESEGCNPDKLSPNLKDKIALIKRGGCTFTEKVNNAASAGAIGVIVYNNAPGTFGASAPGVKIPLISISLENGLELTQAIQSGPIQLTFNKAGSIQPIEDAGTISSFSSVGSSAELGFKPEIAGIGGSVYSTLPRYLKSWGVMSGTSMATPYVAGSVALYLNARRDPIPYIHEQFQNYALPVPRFNTSSLDNPIRQGAGLVQVYDAITRQVHVSPAAISFNDTASHNYRTQSFVVTNSGRTTVRFRLINDVTIGISPYDVENEGYTPLEPVADTVAQASLKFSHSHLTVHPGKSRTVTVHLKPPHTHPRDHIFYGGFIRLQPDRGRQVQIPYFGVVGRQRDLPIYDEGFPTLIDLNSTEYGPTQPFSFDRSLNESYPIVVLRLLTPTAHVKADLLNSTGSVIGQFLTGLDYLGRHFRESNPYSEFPWDGTYYPEGFEDTNIPVSVPEGTYRFSLSALKLLGRPDHSKDWERWTSGPIIVKN